MEIGGWGLGPGIMIPGRGVTHTNPTGVGLNLERIVRWREVFRMAPNRAYRFCSRDINCASVVGTALMIGGAHALLGDKFGSKTWNTPNEVEAYARQVATAIERTAADARVLREHRTLQAMPAADAGPRDASGNRTLMSLDDFKRLSYVGKFARRKEQVAELDGLLARFHGCAAGFDALPAKVTILREMLEQVHEHLRGKPTSDRGHAVLILGEQVLNTILDYQELDAELVTWLPAE